MTVYRDKQAKLARREAVNRIATTGLLLVVAAAADSLPQTYTSNVRLSDGSKYRVTHKVYTNQASSAAVGAITGVPSTPSFRSDSSIKRVK